MNMMKYFSGYLNSGTFVVTNPTHNIADAELKIVADTTSNNIALTIHAPTNVLGKELTVVSTDNLTSNIVTISGTGLSIPINLIVGASVQLFATATKWEIMAERTASGSSPVFSVNGEIGNVLLNAADVVESQGIVNSMLADDVVSLSKTAHAAAGSIVNYDATTAPAYLAPGASGTVLTSQGAGQPLAYTTIVFPVQSVNGETGAVILNAADVVESQGIVNSMLADDVVTLSKTAHAATGSLITYDATTAPINLAPGASGTVLTSQGAGQPLVYTAVTSSYEFLATINASSQASIDFTSQINLTLYKDYVVNLFDMHPVTDDVNLQLLYSSNGGVSFIVTGYVSKAYNKRPAAADLSDGTITTFIPLNVTTGGAGTKISNVAADYYSGVIHIHDVANANTGGLMYHNGTYETAGGSRIFTDGFGLLTPGTVINALRFQFSSGNISSGTAILYGIRR